MFNLNFLQGGQNSIGFISKQDFGEMFYNRTAGKYTKSIDAFIAEHFISLAQHYGSVINQDQVKKIQTYYHDFTKQITLMANLFFWEQPGYILVGSDYNLKNDLNRAAIYMTSTIIQRAINFNFTNNSQGYVISSSKIKRMYSYEFLVILYLSIIIIMNYIAFIFFKRKVIP
ncbi:hypothetical protein [Spiroplasma endosymbiont of Nebria brevicollis]|uniref:hypothetical protein n=1 Tax=Spiroplasma endosymbiont of Nebria brevicollis TaxID=3066284 RepID=UPI00313B2F00